MAPLIGSTRAALLLAAFAVAGSLGTLLAVVLYDRTPGAGPEPPAVVPDKAKPDPRKPWPSSVLSLQDAWAEAGRQAKVWRQDARPVRLYATAVRADGRLQRDRSQVQVVFMSDSAEPGSNAWRWTLQDGGLREQQFALRPQAAQKEAPSQLCAIGELLGPQGPSEVSVDAHFAGTPKMTVFTTQPRWVSVADPHSCEVLGRTGPLQGEDQKPGLPVSVEAVFNRAEARQRVQEAMRGWQQACGRDLSAAEGVLGVSFARAGAVEKVEFVSGVDPSGPLARCIADHVAKAQVRPWSHGRGYVTVPFRLN